MARTVTPSWKIPIVVPGLDMTCFFGGYFDTIGYVAAFLGCLESV
jgi:hypothetical protein